jgi:hypothetical protein
MTFLMETFETKKFVKIFYKAFFYFLKNILQQSSGTYFHFFLNTF